jgi:hypothetical protein
LYRTFFNHFTFGGNWAWFVMFFLDGSHNSIGADEASDSSWLSVVLKAAMDAVVRVSQETLAIDANHLLSNKFFLSPV